MGLCLFSRVRLQHEGNLGLEDCRLYRVLGSFRWPEICSLLFAEIQVYTNFTVKGGLLWLDVDIHS
jgi:hypothetical protein